MGAGFKDFASEVLRSVDVDDYLMKQTVMAFDTAAARDAAVTAPEEGMHAYLADADVVTMYDGTSWVVVVRKVTAKGTLLVADGAELSSLPPSTDGLLLTSDSAQPTGVKWSAAPAGDHIEAKNTAGASNSESVTWTLAFSAIPVVTVSVSTNQLVWVTARSTTGVTVQNASGNEVKMVIAREAT